MRGFHILFCCLFLALTFASAGAPLLAADIKSSREAYPDDRADADDAPGLEDFCYGQRRICRKVCNLRFRDDKIGCPHNCDSREVRCTRAGCFKWTEQELLIAGRFGAAPCPQ